MSARNLEQRLGRGTAVISGCSFESIGFRLRLHDEAKNDNFRASFGDVY